MKLATKLVSAFMVVALVVIGIDTAVAVRAELDGFEQRTRQDMKQMGVTLRGLIAEAYRAGRHAQAMEELAQSVPSDHHMRMRWVWLDTGPEVGPGLHEGVSPQELRAAAEGVVFREAGADGEWAMFAYVHVPTDDERTGAIEIEERPDRRDRVLAVLTTRAWRIAALLLLLAGIASVAVGGRMVARPLRALTEKTRRVGAGDLKGPVELRGHDELAELGRAINEMSDRIAESRDALQRETAERIAAMQQLRHADRLRTVGRLASGIAHEMGTPLNVVAGHAVMIGAGGLSEREVADGARTIKDQAERMAQLVRQLLDFARRSTPEKSRADLRDIVRASVELVETLARKQGAEVDFEAPDQPCAVEADAAQIQQVVTNLLMNAAQAMPGGGRIALRLSSTDEHGRRMARLDVRDEGAGIQPDELDQVFEPFFTTKGAGEGTGLGLAVAEGIAREHGGRIDVESSVGAGSCFSLLLPMEAGS